MQMLGLGRGVSVGSGRLGRGRLGSGSWVTDGAAVASGNPVGVLVPAVAGEDDAGVGAEVGVGDGVVAPVGACVVRLWDGDTSGGELECGQDSGAIIAPT